ncbi:GreA/GreB family elongation factor [Rubrolithibacter danxiaensis]|uniref:GreA/GreB family elongation factor n=1 Tax=Rubrolithibacter danxiaensis TaxID=3390805 RepID=UPI003BF7AD94
METNEIILSRGVYQLVMTHLRKEKELSDFNKNKLLQEMKSAKILPSKKIPDNVVSINTNVKIKDIETEEEFVFNLVSPTEARSKNNKLSVLSPIGLALLGYNSGELVDWEMADGLKKYLIEKVSAME